MKRLSWFVLLALIGVSCLNEPDCFQLNNDLIVVNFKVIGFGDDFFAFRSIQSTGTTVLYDADTTSSVGLYLNPLATEMDYTFATPEGDRKLHVDYRGQVQFVSADCGERYIYSQLSVPLPITDFDSVNVVNTTPTPNPSSNIDLYRCPVTNQMGITFDANVIVKTITADYNEVVITVNDTLFAAETYLLPLNVDKDSTSFKVEYTSGASKTFSVAYSNTRRLLAKQCGFQHILNELRTVNKADATIKVTHTEIQDLPISNLAITP